MRPLVRGARAIWRVLWRSKQLDADMQEEMRFHLEMEADRLVRAHGLDPEEAGASLRPLRRRRTIQGRRTRSAGLYWLDGVSLDARLGVRMLVKHRWLTLVGGVAMTVAIAIGHGVRSHQRSPRSRVAVPARRSRRRGEVRGDENRRRRSPRASRVQHVARSPHHARTGGRVPHGAAQLPWRPTRRRNRSGSPRSPRRRSTSRRRRRSSAATCCVLTRRSARRPSW